MSIECTLMARRHLNINATLLQQKFLSAAFTRVSIKCCWNRLPADGMLAREPILCIRLITMHPRSAGSGQNMRSSGSERNNTIFFSLTHYNFMLILIITVLLSEENVTLETFLRLYWTISDLEVDYWCCMRVYTLIDASYIHITCNGTSIICR